MRPTAYKLKIEDLAQGEYKRSADGAEPSYFLTPWNEQITRARVMGTVVDRFIRDDKSYATLRLDDGSGIIRVRGWANEAPSLEKISIGNVIDVIGRVREFEGEVYLTPEIMLPVEDPNWELVRDLEVIKSRREAMARGVKPRLPPKLEPNTMTVEVPTPEAGFGEQMPVLQEVPDENKDRVLQAIKEGEGEEGVSGEEIVSKTGMLEADADNIIRALLAEGKIFEPRAGSFKTVV
jgi:hypothetical protein